MFFLTLAQTSCSDSPLPGSEAGSEGEGETTDMAALPVAVPAQQQQGQQLISTTSSAANFSPPPETVLVNISGTRYGVGMSVDDVSS